MKRLPPKPRNPEALVLLTNPLFRTRRERSEAEKFKKEDSWDRAAKHKNSKIDHNENIKDDPT